MIDGFCNGYPAVVGSFAGRPKASWWAQNVYSFIVRCWPDGHCGDLLKMWLSW